MGAFFFPIGFTPLQKIIDLNGLYTNGVAYGTPKVLGIMGIACICSIAVMVLPSSCNNRLSGIISGFIIIQVINVLRVAGLAYSRS